MSLATPARTMYDSTSAADIPADAEMVAGYVDGAYLWSASDWARFPNAVHVQISTRANGNVAYVLDVERGDATPAEAPGWIERMQAAGIEQPTIYCAASAVPAIRAVCAGLLYWLWVADWTGQPHPVSYAAAVQYANEATSGGHYDLSIVYSPPWPGPHVPPVTGGPEMTIDLARLHVWTWYASILRRVPEDQAAVDVWASQLATPGVNYESVITAFCQTPEAQAALARA